MSIEECLSKAEEISPLSRQKLHFETLDELTQQNVSNAGASDLTAAKLNKQALAMRSYIEKLSALLEGNSSRRETGLHKGDRYIGNKKIS